MAFQVHYQQSPPPPQPLHHPSIHSGGTTSNGHISQGIATIWNLENLRQALPISFPLDNPQSILQLEQHSSPPPPWQKVLNLEPGEIYYSERTEERSPKETGVIMSRRNGTAPKLDLKLNLSPPRGNLLVQSPSRSSTVSPTSPSSSCLSSELNQEATYTFSNSPDSTAMIVAGCPRCLMYIMLPEKDPRCPKCKSTVLLEVFNETTKTDGAHTKTTRK